VRIVVVGIGNDFRGDDGAGLATVRLLKSRSLPNTEIIELNGEITRLVDVLPLFDAAILIDASRSKAPPGTIHRKDLSHESLPADNNQRSTHGISLSSVVELARGGEAFPGKVIFYGIEGQYFDHSPDLTPAVAEASEKVSALIGSEIASWG
jgi:hydrogenase maturation protease